MKTIIQAACSCHRGKVRRTNQDNLYFDGKCLELKHEELRQPAVMETELKNGLCLAVFDGMGGENFGEYASYAAARQMQQTQRKLLDFLVPERRYLREMTQKLNAAVRTEQASMLTDRMGTTLVGLYFSGRYVYVCNVGDSRAYRLRDGVFQQLSKDHVVQTPADSGKKQPLSQYLGYGDDEIEIEPYIAKGPIKRGDQYLLCSDGLTDMLSNMEICDIMLRCTDTEECARALIDAALERGGKDNVTVIVCRLV